MQSSFPEAQQTQCERSLTFEKDDLFHWLMEKSSFPEAQRTLYEQSAHTRLVLLKYYEGIPRDY